MISIEKAIIISSLILSSSIFGAGAMYVMKPEYEFITVNDNQNRPAFTVRANNRDGTRCLMREGWVLFVDNWEKAAVNFSAPTILCPT